MSGKNADQSESGSPIIRHQPRSKPFELSMDSPDIDQINQHVEKYVGKIESVFHELLSDLVHIDVHVIPPTPERNFITFVTSGMSTYPMKTPSEFSEYQFAELIICLPSGWPLDEESAKDEKNYWPIRLLRMLARFPHEYDTWLSYAHTVPNGDPPRPYADNTRLTGVILAPPLLFPPEFFTLKISEDKTIHFFALVPLHTDEMNFKIKKGASELFDLFDKKGVTELLSLERPSAIKKRWWPF